MIDERTRELVNAAIDDELSAAERVELDELLATSPQARQYEAELRRLDAVLEELPRQPLPADLHARIIESVQLPARPEPGRAGPTAWPAALRYGLAASIGLMVAVGIYESQSLRTTAPDVDMLGTMAPAGNGDTELGSYSVERPGLVSRARLIRRGDALVLDVTFDGDGPIELDIDLSASGLRFAALTQAQVESFGFGGDALRAGGRGPQHFSVLLRREPGQPGSEAVLGLAYSRNGELIQEGTLEAEQAGVPKGL